MAIANNMMSTYPQISSAKSDHEQLKNGDITRKDMWSSMLDGVASGKRLPEKNILVLGGSSESQKEFLEALSSDASIKRTQDRHNTKQPPVANNFALGYTYQDVLDADHEDVIARLSIYLLADPSSSFTSLLRPLLSPDTIPNTLIVILLDWSQPWHWLRQLRDWIRLLRTLLVSLDTDSKSKMEEVMVNWRDRGRGTTSLEGGGSSTATDGEVSLPSGPGEWEEALGLPLCVVCQNSDQIEMLERERAWKEEEFDFVLQFLRTVLLKHGASLIYTIPSAPSSMQTLIHSSLGIHSLLKRRPLKHNVIDRDKVVVPPNWDSWGKIRVLREGFDVEGVNRGWSVDIEEPSASLAKTSPNSAGDQLVVHVEEEKLRGALAVFEEMIRDPVAGSLPANSTEDTNNGLEVQSLDGQSFLGNQLEILERIKQGSDSSQDSRRGLSGGNLPEPDSHTADESGMIEEGRVNEHIGPVQFNMGGIQVDADDMLKRLKNRQIHQTPEPEAHSIISPDGKSQNEALASFFAGLMRRGGSSAPGSPKP